MKILLIILFACAALLSLRVREADRFLFTQEQAHLKPIPGDTPEPLFASTIVARSKQAGLGRLKDKNLPADGLEFRVWVGFGKKPLEGFVVSRIGDNWHATFLESSNAVTKPPYRKDSIEPRSGWAQFWNRLVAESFLSLPDRSLLKDEEMVFDGTSYVVELKDHHTYRTYTYLNPDYQKWPEARHMSNIADILYSEFSIQR